MDPSPRVTEVSIKTGASPSPSMGADARQAIATFAVCEARLAQLDEEMTASRQPLVATQKACKERLKEALRVAGSTCVPVRLPEVDKPMYVRLKKTNDTRPVDPDVAKEALDSISSEMLAGVAGGGGTGASAMQAMRTLVCDAIRRASTRTVTRLELSSSKERRPKGEAPSTETPPEVEEAARRLHEARLALKEMARRTAAARAEIAEERARQEPALRAYLSSKPNETQKVRLELQGEERTYFIRRKRSEKTKRLMPSAVEPLVEGSIERALAAAGVADSHVRLDLLLDGRFRAALLETLLLAMEEARQSAVVVKDRVALTKPPDRKRKRDDPPHDDRRGISPDPSSC